MNSKFESREDYLERILMLQEKMSNVRAIDIATSMEFSKPSVSIALKKLKAENFIEVDEATGYITLTTQGRNVAENVYTRHKTLTKMFIMLGVDPEIAKQDACRIEHDLSDETFNKIQEHLKSHEM